MKIEYTSANGDLIVETGVNARQFFSQDEIDSHRALDNCIRITVKHKPTDTVHLLQYVTRQYPDLYEYRQSKYKTLVWDTSPGKHFMSDSSNPKWKLDIPEEESTSPYYEELGLHKKMNSSTSFYDYPGGDYETQEERFVFCSFVFINDRVQYKVQLVKQRTVTFEEFYDVKVQLWTSSSLPFWAINVLKMYCDAKKINMPGFVSRGDLLELHNKSKEDIMEESSLYFFQPNRKWLTFIEYPKLFPEFLCTNEIDVVLGKDFPLTIKSLILEYSNLPALPQATDSDSNNITTSIKA